MDLLGIYIAMNDYLVVAVSAVTSIILSLLDPLQPSVTMWLHFDCSAPYRPSILFLISDIRAL